MWIVSDAYQNRGMRGDPPAAASGDHVDVSGGGGGGGGGRVAGAGGRVAGAGAVAESRCLAHLLVRRGQANE